MFEYRELVQEQQQEIMIGHYETPVARLAPIARDEEPALMNLREVVRKYQTPSERSALREWDATK